MEEAQQLCDRIVVMYQGKILKEGTPGRLVDEEIGKEVVEVRTPPEDDARILGHIAGFDCSHERVGDTLYIYSRDGHGLMKKLLELDLPNTLNRPATLEDVFLKLTGRSLHE
jgi:lipooligosaccharide transport system ATP-binding protein